MGADRRIHRFGCRVLLAALPVAASCSYLDYDDTNSGSKTIDAISDGIALPTFRAVFSGHSPQTPPSQPNADTSRGGPAPAPQRVSNNVAFEISASYAGDEVEQDVAAGEVVRFDGQAFPGPTTLPFRYDMVEVSGSVRAGVDFGRAQLAFLGGVGFNYFEGEIEGMDPRVRDREGRLGPLVGAHLRIDLLEWLALYGRTTYLWSITAGSGQLEGGVEFEPVEGLGLLAGYRYWRYRNTEWGSDTDSDINIVINGIVLGAEVRF